jgi:hypothetical protein
MANGGDRRSQVLNRFKVQEVSLVIAEDSHVQKLRSLMTLEIKGSA